MEQMPDWNKKIEGPVLPDTEVPREIPSAWQGNPEHPTSSVPPVYSPSAGTETGYAYSSYYGNGHAYSGQLGGYTSPANGGWIPPVGQMPPPGPYPSPSSGQYPPVSPAPYAPYGASYGAWCPAPEVMEEPEDPARLRILVSGRDLFPQEYVGLRRITAGGGRMATLLFALLTLLFGWMALSAAVTGASGDIVAATLILVTGCLVFLLIDLLLYGSQFHRKCEGEYAAMCYNPNNPAPVNISEFYDDRVVVTTARGSTVVPYSRVTAYVETAGQIALFVGRDFVCWRGGDLTPYDARLIREHLRRRVHPSVVRIKHEVIPCLQRPLPIPDLNNSDQLVVRARIDHGNWDKRRNRFHGLMAQLPEMLSMLLVLATATAQYWILSNWFLLDVLVFFAVYFLVGLLLALLLLLPVADRQANEDTWDLAFTRDGLAMRRNGFTGFIYKERIRVVPVRDGVSLEMPSGALLLPWAAVEDAERLKGLLNLHGSA